MIEVGVCRNTRCPKCVSGEQIERYPGPGEYCPECGERLEPVTVVAREALTADEYEAFHERMQRLIVPPPADPEYSRRLIITVAIIIALALVGAMIVLHPLAFGARPIAARVCGSTGTDVLASNIVRAYSAKTRMPLESFSVNAPGTSPCDVRFWAAKSSKRGATIAHDAVVAVVNPQNSLTRLSAAQLRRIFGGKIRDWSAFGEQAGTITPLLPGDRSDEVKALESSLFRRMKIGKNVRRDMSSASIVRAVASASGRRLIGLVTFSGAVPAKVLAVDASTPPSTLSIADHRYLLAFDVMVGSDLRNPSANATDLIAFARSDEAQAIVVHTGFVGRHGF